VPAKGLGLLRLVDERIAEVARAPEAFPRDPKDRLRGARGCWSQAIQKHIAPNGVLTLRDGGGDVFENVPVNNFGSNVLCERHNNALSGVDAGALRFFQTGPETLEVLQGKRTTAWCGASMARVSSAG
jgi:hypothetical protein